MFNCKVVAAAAASFITCGLVLGKCLFHPLTPKANIKQRETLMSNIFVHFSAVVIPFNSAICSMLIHISVTPM